MRFALGIAIYHDFFFLFFFFFFQLFIFIFILLHFFSFPLLVLTLPAVGNAETHSIQGCKIHEWRLG